MRKRGGMNCTKKTKKGGAAHKMGGSNCTGGAAHKMGGSNCTGGAAHKMGEIKYGVQLTRGVE